MRKLFLILLFIPFNLSAQTYWAASQGGPIADEVMGVAADASGNVYSTGYFGITGNFGSVTLNSQGVTDMMLVKTNPAGTVLWAVSAGGAGTDRGLSVHTDNNFVYVTGFFSGTANFGSTVLTASGSQDIFVAKYTQAGALVWAKGYGGLLTDQGNSVTSDPAGNVIVTGQFSGTVAFGSTSVTSMNNPSGNPSIDIFILKLSPGGNELWLQQGSAKFTERGLGAASDNLGNIYVAGQFSDTLVFDNTYNTGMQNQAYLVKFDSLGNEQWFRHISSGSFSIANSVDVTPNGEPVVTGDFGGTLTFANSPITVANAFTEKIYLLRYSNSGNLLWGISEGSSDAISSRDVFASSGSEILIAGHFKCVFGSLSSQYGSGTFNSVGERDVFLSVYNSAGTFSFARQAGGKKEDLGHSVSKAGNIPVIGGSFNEYLNFPSPDYIPNIGGNAGSAVNVAPDPVYCSDNLYDVYGRLSSQGASEGFVLTVLDTSRETYDFYHRTGSGCLRDALPVCISTSINPESTGCSPDSITSCGGVTLYAISRTAQTWNSLYQLDTSIGPDYSYLWSTGSIQRSVSPTLTGTYWVRLTSADGCYQTYDTIHVTINSLPPTPCISDNFYPAVDSVDYDIAVCDSGSVLAWPSCLGPSIVQTDWQAPGGIPLPGDTVTINQDGIYTLCATDTNGCSSCTFVEMIIDTLKSIPPMVAVPQPYPNDTIAICTGDILNLFVSDSLDNVPQLIPQITLDVAYCYTINGGPPVCDTTTYPNIPIVSSTSGDVTVTFSIIAHFINACGADTLISDSTYSFYLDLLPKPDASVTLAGPGPLCPGSSDTIFAHGGYNLTWSGPSHNSLNDSTIVVNLPGWYNVGSSLTYPNGCSDAQSVSYFVSIKPSPTITMSPGSGVICPNDSVQLTVNSAYPVIWQGPNGYAGNTTTIYASTPGNYYAVVTDPDSCVLVSNTLELKQYTAPYMVTFPQPMICNGDSILLQVFGTDGSTIIWQSPLSGTQDCVFVYSPGIYSVEVSACGITDTLNVTIVPSTVTASITPQGPVNFCSGDTLVAHTNAGMNSYQWSNGSTVDSTLITQPGSYTVTLLDTNGCYSTDTISVVPYTTPPPVISDTIVCYGDSALLIASGNGTINWYSSTISPAPLATGDSLLTPPVFTGITYFASLTDSTCISARVPVTAYPDSASLPFSASANSPVCEGDSLFLSAPGFSNTSWSWSGPSGFSSTSQNPFVAPVQLNDSGYYFVTISSLLCSGNTDSVLVDINTYPVANASSNSPVCAGDSLLLSADTSIGSSYTWMTPTGFSPGQSLVYISATTGHSGQYVLAVNSSGCISFDTISVTVNPLPPAPVVSSNSPVCEGDSILLSSTGVAGSSFTWSGPGSFSSTLANPFIFPADTFHNGTYSVTSTVNGCTGTSSSLTISVTNVPDSIPVTANDPLCEGDNLILSANAPATGIFSWTGPLSYSSGQATDTLIAVTTQQSGWYTVNYTINGCPAPSGQVLVSVFPVPGPPVISADDTLCADDLLTLNGSHSGNGTFTWLGPNGFTSSAEDTSFFASTSSTGLYTATFSANGCESDADSLYVVVQPSPPDPAPFASGPFCEGSVITLNAVVGAGAGYQWTGPGGFQAGSGNWAIQNAGPEDAGTYYLTAFIGNCIKGPFPVSVQVNPAPTLDLTGDTLICYGSEATLQSPGLYTTYLWSTGSTETSIQPNSAGIYTLTVSNDYGCKASDGVEIKVTDCTDFQAPNAFTPNGDGINDRFTVWHYGVTGLKVKIYNRWGQLLHEWADPFGGWDGIIQRNGKEAPEGVYYWLAEYQLFDGTNFSKKGFFHLMR